MSREWHIFPQIAATSQISERISALAHVAIIINSTYYLYFVLCYLKAWFDHFTTAAFDILLGGVHAKFALAYTSIALKNTSLLIDII